MRTRAKRAATTTLAACWVLARNRSRDAFVAARQQQLTPGGRWRRRAGWRWRRRSGRRRSGVTSDSFAGYTNLASLEDRVNRLLDDELRARARDGVKTVREGHPSHVDTSAARIDQEQRGLARDGEIEQHPRHVDGVASVGGAIAAATSWAVTAAFRVVTTSRPFAASISRIGGSRSCISFAVAPTTSSTCSPPGRASASAARELREQMSRSRVPQRRDGARVTDVWSARRDAPVRVRRTRILGSARGGSSTRRPHRRHGAAPRGRSRGPRALPSPTSPPAFRCRSNCASASSGRRCLRRS